MQTLDQTFVHILVEELQIILAVVKSPANAILDEVLFYIHQIVFVDKGNLRLNHPELSQVSRRVAVLGAERRTEGVNLTQRHSAQLALQLSAYGECRLPAKEVVGVIYLPVIVLLEVVQVLGGYLEHLSGALAVRGGDERRVEIEVSVLVEVGVDSHGHVVTDAEHSAKRVRTRAQVRNGAQVFHTQTFLLQRIFLGVGSAEHLKLRQLYLHRLSGTLAGNQQSCGTDACTGSYRFELLLAELAQVGYNLNVLDGRAVIEGNE